MEDSLFNVRVLIVDDDKLVRDIAKDMLIYHCDVIDVVSSGPEAIQAVQEYPYDIVFMDYCMPVMDGIQATRCIRNLEAQGMCYRDPAPSDAHPSQPSVAHTPRNLATSDEHLIPGSPMNMLDQSCRSAGKNTRSVPIIAFTAQVTEEVRAQCLAAGMDDFLAKPVGINQLEEKIIQWVRPTRHHKGFVI